MDTPFSVHDSPAHPYPKQKAGLMKGLLVPIVFLLLMGALAVSAYFVISRKATTPPSVGSYDECVKLPGSIIQESYPQVCVTADGSRFTQQIDNQTAPTDMVVNTPKSGEMVKSPLSVQGTVPAGWMFEGGFPLLLTDESGVTIAQTFAKETIPGSWSSGAPVPFAAELVFQTTSKSGFIVFQKDNPSGLPENAQSFKIPVNLDSKVTEDPTLGSSNNEALCSSNSGQWNEEYTECTGVTNAACGQMRGTFNECASACRHSSDASAPCIQICVAVCDF